jgi:hypothetical protein
MYEFAATSNVYPGDTVIEKVVYIILDVNWNAFPIVDQATAPVSVKGMFYTNVFNPST